MDSEPPVYESVNRWSTSHHRMGRRVAGIRGERVKVLRERRGLTLNDLGRRLGMTASGVWRWESGRSQIPSATLPSLAAELGVSVGELFEEPEAPTAPAGFDLLADQLRRALELGPERIEINVYVRDRDQVDEKPPPGARFMRNFIREWREMSDEERRELEALMRSQVEGE